MLSNLSDNQFMTYPLLHPDRPCLESTKTVSFDSQLQAYDKCISSQHSSLIDLDMSCDFASDNSPEILGNCAYPEHGIRPYSSEGILQNRSIAAIEKWF